MKQTMSEIYTEAHSSMIKPYVAHCQACHGF